MRTINKLACLIAAFAAMGCSQLPQNRSIDNPEALADNTSNNLRIVKVEMTDSSTVLTGRIEFRPGWWVRISPESYIEADGEKYIIAKTDGIELGEQHIMPESGVDTVKLFFPAIPAQTKVIDFSEGGDGWAIYGIDVTGKGRDKSISLPEADGDICIEPVLKADSTNINIHILGYRPGFGNKLDAYIFDTYDNSQDFVGVPVDSIGNASLCAILYGNSAITLKPAGLGNYTQSIIVAPGGTIDITIDPAYTLDRYDKSRDIRRIADNGRYAALNALVQTLARGFNANCDSLKNVLSASYTTGPAEYTDIVLEVLEKTSANIDKLEVPDKFKEYLHAQADMEALDMMTTKESRQAHALAIKHNRFIETYKDSIGAPLRDEDFARVKVNLDNPVLRLFHNYAYVVGDAKRFGNYPAANDMSIFINKFNSAHKGTLTEADLDTLRSLSEPFYAQAAQLCQAEALRLQNDVSKIINPTPDAPDNKVFDAIIAPYKGKVVMVDLWNTWCGPCRHALAANEPLKTGEFANDDIVWVYIADTSSDYTAYSNMIKSIKGEHFLVNSDQIKAIRQKFDVDGIPYYILVDREGNATGHPDYRDHDKLVQGIKSAL